eukprot:CAMPEP_0170523234 /NCGR_PEP_ID=MMETSP0209-20121228/8664_1 /TAXON_ID=665100 ORGANISM="Litonotus pictus, Strain P1" /NCGR_SAMPLE_ID=MMETSP0209 /ASSEMBLY_ACC=CAM_ASM_000301 /LENGTH=234 /DNA_ID=CAMNT_0010811219 /DNA_START=9 /DNA_END=713 /DNA_ORIENTATION=-
MSTYNVKDANSLSELNKHLSTNMFVGGLHPNAQDALVWEAFNDTCPDVNTHPAVAAWFNLFHYFRYTVDHLKTITGEEHKKGGKHEAKKEKKEEKKEKKEDVDDMFGDDEDEDPEVIKAREEKQAKAKAAKEAKKGKKDEKKGVIAKSIILLDVKGYELEQDFDALAKKIHTIKMEGLEWKQEYKIDEIAFGMKKLIVGLVVEDDKVSVDDVIEVIVSWEEEVQSIDIASFNKV